MSGFRVSPVEVYHDDQKGWCYMFSISYSGSVIVGANGYHEKSEDAAYRAGFAHSRSLLKDFMLDAAREIIRLENELVDNWIASP